ncbi:Mds3 protein [Maudiozyma humilis]|uniref:Mds3 protein n=1 Tax=Maudiozyma humilis TaxID=51915 RepID=A0AAV5RR37_MAUHU|nr:Mds3 protein [Kazachstania humilis]
MSLDNDTPQLQPSTCTGYHLKLPQIPTTAEYSALDRYARRKLTLECRTGAALHLARSNLYVHGGLTIPLNIDSFSILQLQKELILYFSRSSNTKDSFENLNQWLSSEVFFLDLVSRTWRHLETTVDLDAPLCAAQNALLEEDPVHSPFECPVRGRLCHSMCVIDSALYIFGGLVVSPQTGYELIATNELWRLDLRSRKWRLLSNSPCATRRFNHSMHVKNADCPSSDTQLVIVGGTNNISEPVSQVDVYNITQNCWQAEVQPRDDLRLDVNIDSEKVALSAESNFSILVENNEAKIPALILYNPNNKFQLRRQSSNGSSSSDDENYAINDSRDVHIITSPLNSRSNSNKMISPMTTLPLLSDSKGMRLAFNNMQTPDILRQSFNLQFPSGEYFGFNIILGGFYPNCSSENFCVFVYDIPSGRWTRVSIRSPAVDVTSTRFWKLFVWKSHHQTLLLGTSKNDDCLPSVQKFDHLLTFGLPLINAFNKIVSPRQLNTLENRAEGLSSLASLQPGIHDPIQQLVFETEDQPTRSMSTTSGVTSQFESYIKYIAPSFELTTIRSTFPSFATVLGKDLLDIYGDSVTDFQFITSEGDSVGVPMYLLRKRWGRYFDFLLSKGYSRICLENELNMKRSMLVKHTPLSSRITSRASSRQDSFDLIRDSTRSSFSKLSNKESPRSSNALERTVSGPHRSLSQIFMNDVDDSTKYQKSKTLPRVPSGKVMADPPIILKSPLDEEYDINDPVSPPPNELGMEDSIDESKSQPIKRTGTTSTTSSTNGMVFRVPFQDSNAPVEKIESPFHRNTDQRRRSSLMDSTRINEDILLSRRNSAFKRRASHPNNSVKFSDTTPSSPKLNKKLFSKFPSSARSSFSIVSSLSDKKRNSLPSLNSSSEEVNKHYSVMNVDLPPPTSAPVETLPDVPIIKFGSDKPNGSMYDFNLSNKGSPFSSRRASFVSASSNPDWKGVSSSMNTLTLDEKLLEKNDKLNRESQPDASRQSMGQFKSYIFRKGSNSGENSLSNIQSFSDRTRPSIASFSEGSDSIFGSTPYDMEPLLIPRSLYMPWPTSSIRAFAEFFCTGQTNRKWLLAPVTLDLLVMARLYEIPLLYTLIAEMLYTILGRKEEGLFVICTSLKSKFVKQVRKMLENDTTKVDEYLKQSDNYKELLRLHKALVEMDNGFLNFDLLKRNARNHSISTHNSSDPDDLDRNFHRAASTGSFANMRQSIISYGSKDSSGSLGAAGFPPTLNFQDQRNSVGATSSRTKKKSSLSKEINPSSFHQFEAMNLEKNLPGTVKDSLHQNVQKPRYNSATHDFGDFDLGVELSTSSSDDTSEDSESDVGSSVSTERQQSRMGRTKSSPELESLSTIVDVRTNEDEDEAEFENNIKKLSVPVPRNKTNKVLLGNYVDSGLGMSSLSKLKKKVQKAEGDHDESVDPLFKISSTLHSPGRPQSGVGRSSTHGSAYGETKSGPRPTKTSVWDEEYSMLRLENIIATNALPPVDHIIKYIYKTAVVVNDIKMTIRCADCLEVSKGLRTVKKELLADLGKLQESIAK